MEKYCEKFEIRIIRNVPYRPDFNGIEGVWSWAKQEYRKKLDWLKANGLEWNNLHVVQEVLDSLPP